MRCVLSCFEPRQQRAICVMRANVKSQKIRRLDATFTSRQELPSVPVQHHIITLCKLIIFARFIFFYVDQRLSARARMPRANLYLCANLSCTQSLKWTSRGKTLLHMSFCQSLRTNWKTSSKETMKYALSISNRLGSANTGEGTSKKNGLWGTVRITRMLQLVLVKLTVGWSRRE